MSHARFDLRDRTALVTGATRGIGRAIAQGLGEQGARAVITGRKEETVTSTAQELKAVGIEAIGKVCHQGSVTAIEHLFQDLDSEGWTPDLVVVNAATNPVYGPIMDLDAQAWQKIVDVNISGSLFTAQQAAKRMIEKKNGSIIFISSVAALEPIPGLGGYSISKASMLGLMRALALELGPQGIRVNAIAPGLVETKFSSALFENRTAYEGMIAPLPLRRHGQPEDIVGAAIFLASDQSAYVTGQTFVVDGGSCM